MRFPTHRSSWIRLGAGILTWTLVLPALGGFQPIAGLYEAGRYEEARQSLETGELAARPGEEALWYSRLAEDPDVAVDVLAASTDDASLPAAVRLRAALEIAEIEAARGEFRRALRAMEPLLLHADVEIPGAMYLQAGICLRALGDLQRAREMLASVRPDDPAFLLARGTLGEIGLQQGDVALARRYFESATEAQNQSYALRNAAGWWQALRQAGDDEEADRLRRLLHQEHPGSLALLEINTLLQIQAEEESAVPADQPYADAGETVTDSPGRYSLQLGAFSDRSLALEFQERYRDQLADLRIDSVRDDRGQILYKLRTGSFVNPALARTEAKRLRRALGIEIIVADLTD